ncbi:MAG: polysaccharide biosynthesis C-terminal domain-containing protein, partial [Acidobacteriota bacterium]|nr:polysaccharide biosynthesis C-terminal domain-containing protein [Acidobacteriota bacterium]
ALKVLAPAFYALNDARTPMIVSMISVAINYATATTMVRVAGLGHAGLALSTSTVALFGFVALLAIMRRRIGGIEGGALLSSFLKIAAASAVMAIACAATSYLIRHGFGVTIKAQIVDLLVSIPAGAAVFYAVASGLQVKEIEMARKTVAAPLLRRLGFTPK